MTVLQFFFFFFVYCAAKSELVNRRAVLQKCFVCLKYQRIGEYSLQMNEVKTFQRICLVVNDVVKLELH